MLKYIAMVMAVFIWAGGGVCFLTCTEILSQLGERLDMMIVFICERCMHWEWLTEVDSEIEVVLSKLLIGLNCF